jgi:hypothetical protein
MGSLLLDLERLASRALRPRQSRFQIRVADDYISL